MRLTSFSALLACTVIALAACSSSETEPTVEEDDDHGEIEGAEEVEEAQYRLVVADEDGHVAVLDLLDETVEHVELEDEATGLSTDGRFAYVRTESGLQVVDSGVWTWPHGDHNHYYRAPVADLGLVDVGSGHVNGIFGSDTALFDDDTGEVVLLDRDALEDGDLESHVWASGDPHHGFALAIEDQALGSTVSAEGLPDGLNWYDADGNAEELDVPCGEMHGTARHGDLVVAACDDGAVLVDGDSVELVEYPDGTSSDERAWSFDQRPGSDTIAAIRGDAGAWLFDITDREWTEIEVPNPAASVALGADQGILVLDEDGTLHHFDDDGESLAETSVMEDLDPEHAPTLLADPSRAYLNDINTGEIYEIDYADDLRLARTLEVDIEPAYLVGTGW